MSENRFNVVSTSKFEKYTHTKCVILVDEFLGKTLKFSYVSRNGDSGADLCVWTDIGWKTLFTKEMIGEKVIDYTWDDNKVHQEAFDRIYGKMIDIYSKCFKG